MARLSDEALEQAIAQESEQFRTLYRWLDAHMPDLFFEEVDQEHIMLIVHNLISFSMQNYFSQVFVNNAAFVMMTDSPDVNVRVLQHYNLYGIQNYQTFLSDEPPPMPGMTGKLRIAAIYFSEYKEENTSCELSLSQEELNTLKEDLEGRHPELTEESLRDVLCTMNGKFLRSLSEQRIHTALDLYLRAKSRDYCQYDLQLNEDFDIHDVKKPSMRLLFAWRNTPKHRFLYRFMKMIYRHNLAVTRVNLTYVEPYSKGSVLILGVGLNGIEGNAAWEACELNDFIRELTNLKFVEGADEIEEHFVDTQLLSGNNGNLLRSMVSFVHQMMTHDDPFLYSFANVTESFCRHPDLTKSLVELFEYRFHPERVDESLYLQTKREIEDSIYDLDTGNQVNDQRRKNCLTQAIAFVDSALKTNFYRMNKSAFSFRLDPEFMRHLPYDRTKIFPEIPFGIFFLKGMQFIGFQLRFKDISRGGVRTVMPQKHEQMVAERNNVFAECYNLAYTQHKKNKDIPEGGAKAVIFLEPYDQLALECDIYKRELIGAGLPEEEIDQKITMFSGLQKSEYLYQTQRAFVHSLVTLVNCTTDGLLKAKDVIDYLKKPEYIYLGPDENMHNIMIDWIANYSVRCGYKPGMALISSKPRAGINHKEFGVTSYGVNVCMIETLKSLGIDPYKDSFTIKISGGPDGDVAGNEINNLHRFFPNTAKLLAITDISGTMYDPQGLDLTILKEMFENEKPLREYPPENLHDGGFMLDLETKKKQSSYAQVTLCYRKKGSELVQDWLSGNDMNALFRSNLNTVQTDIFIPAGGRPRTLNQSNYTSYLDAEGKPSSKAIVEGANLYLTPFARSHLEEKGLIIIKDSSANKGGVIASSYEVLFGLTLSVDEFVRHKEALMKQVLAIIHERAEDEAKLLLSTHKETGAPLTELSDLVSEKINTYMYELLEYLNGQPFPKDENNPLIKALFAYCPPLLVDAYKERIIESIPDTHKNAIIACYIASKTVYKKGLDWSPSLKDVLSHLAEDPTLYQ